MIGVFRTSSYSADTVSFLCCWLSDTLQNCFFHIPSLCMLFTQMYYKSFRLVTSRRAAGSRETIIILIWWHSAWHNLLFKCCWRWILQKTYFLLSTLSDCKFLLVNIFGKNVLVKSSSLYKKFELEVHFTPHYSQFCPLASLRRGR